jgi:hypothetical protein
LILAGGHVDATDEREGRRIFRFDFYFLCSWSLRGNTAIEPSMPTEVGWMFDIAVALPIGSQPALYQACGPSDRRIR